MSVQKSVIRPTSFSVVCVSMSRSRSNSEASMLVSAFRTQALKIGILQVGPAGGQLVGNAKGRASGSAHRVTMPHNGEQERERVLGRPKDPLGPFTDLPSTFSSTIVPNVLASGGSVRTALCASSPYTPSRNRPLVLVVLSRPRPCRSTSPSYSY